MQKLFNNRYEAYKNGGISIDEFININNHIKILHKSFLAASIKQERCDHNFYCEIAHIVNHEFLRSAYNDIQKIQRASHQNFTNPHISKMHGMLADIMPSKCISKLSINKRHAKLYEHDNLMHEAENIAYLSNQNPLICITNNTNLIDMIKIMQSDVAMMGYFPVIDDNYSKLLSLSRALTIKSDTNIASAICDVGYNPINDTSDFSALINISKRCNIDSSLIDDLHQCVPDNLYLLMRAIIGYQYQYHPYQEAKIVICNDLYQALGMINQNIVIADFNNTNQLSCPLFFSTSVPPEDRCDFVNLVQSFDDSNKIILTRSIQYDGYINIISEYANCFNILQEKQECRAEHNRKAQLHYPYTARNKTLENDHPSDVVKFSNNARHIPINVIVNNKIDTKFISAFNANILIDDPMIFMMQECMKITYKIEKVPRKIFARIIKRHIAMRAMNHNTDINFEIIERIHDKFYVTFAISKIKNMDFNIIFNLGKSIYYTYIVPIGDYYVYSEIIGIESHNNIYLLYQKEKNPNINTQAFCFYHLAQSKGKHLHFITLDNYNIVITPLEGVVNYQHALQRSAPWYANPKRLPWLTKRYQSIIRDSENEHGL